MASIRKAQNGDVLKKNKSLVDSLSKKNMKVLDTMYTAKPAPKAKEGKWIQKATASIKRRGTEGKCTPITKPGCTGKAKSLAKTFKKIAAKRKGK